MTDCANIDVSVEEINVLVDLGGGAAVNVAAVDGTFLAGVAVNGHRAVVILANGRVEHFTPANPEHAGCSVGVSLNAAAVGDAVRVRHLGQVTLTGWSWTRGQPLFAIADGLLSHTPGTGVAVQVAEAISATSIFVRCEPPIFLI